MWAAEAKSSEYAIAFSYSAIPFSSAYVGSGVALGLFYIIAVSSLVVVGLLMAGWASNSHYPLMGSLRSGAQMVSYEVSIGANW